jgi:hypothetical protein
MRPAAQRASRDCDKSFMADSMHPRLKAGLANAILVVVTVAVTYLAGQLVLFRYLAAHMPPSVRPYLSDRASFFAQSSAAHDVPHDYIALVGDSNAEGVGDWLLSAGSDKPHHSADVIHALTGRDVASFGRSGAGSAEAMVLRVTRILGDGGCYAFPSVEEPKQLVVYFYEGNDVDDNNGLIARAIHARGPGLPAAVDAFLDRDYGVVSGWRCYSHLGEMMFRMARFVVRYRFRPNRVIDLRPGKNRVVIAEQPTGTPALQLPSMALDDQEIADGITVYDRSLAWLRRKHPNVPATVIYLPSPATTYRHAGADVIGRDVYEPEASRRAGQPVIDAGRAFPVADIYRRSQHICEAIRAATLANGAAFVDARPLLRATGAHQPVHGPRDWKHPNETGYRLIGALVAQHLDDRPADACDDSWPGQSAPP